MASAVAALAPLVYIFYAARRVTFITWTGALVSFIAGFVLTLLLQQWQLFYARFIYLLAVSLLAVSITYTWWGMFTRRWTFYLFAAAAWVYIIVLAVVVFGAVVLVLLVVFSLVGVAPGVALSPAGGGACRRGLLLAVLVGWDGVQVFGLVVPVGGPLCVRRVCVQRGGGRRVSRRGSWECCLR